MMISMIDIFIIFNFRPLNYFFNLGPSPQATWTSVTRGYIQCRLAKVYEEGGRNDDLTQVPFTPNHV